MEGSGAGIGRLDTYEDMFKEITRKLYGEDPDHRTSSVQNEFEAVSFKAEIENENGNDGNGDEANWIYEEDTLKGTDGSRVAAYHATKSAWRCYECGECMSSGPREVAEHFMELHSSRMIGDDGRRHHSPRKDYLQAELKLEDVLAYLEKVRDRAERIAPPLRKTQETQTAPATLLPVTSSFLLQELPSAATPSPQHIHQGSSNVSPSNGTSASGKRYMCPYCPYGTDRRDLYTRHENIHREEKPFHCYVCFKPFNRADHVKKHFLRMHREHTYELSRIRRLPGSTNTAPKSVQQDANAANGANVQHNTYAANFNNNKSYQLQASATSSGNVYQTQGASNVAVAQVESNCGTRRLQNGGCNSKSHLKGGSKSAQEKRYTCCYCPWSGVDNWCLKRHLNTHLKPFACTLCEYKAARAERLSTHVLKVHNRRQCSRCNFLAEDAAELQVHQLHVHRVSNASAPAAGVAPAPTVASPPQPQNNRHQQPLHPVGNGRPPPGPPVFPAPAPAIAPTTAASLPPSTILGDAADDPSAPSRRCRKQSQPRKISADDAAVQEVDPAKQGQPTEDDSRVTPYQTKASLILHTVCCAKDIEDIALEDITLYANANSPYQR